MEQTIREILFEQAEEDYRLFTSKLLPNIDNILGVRLPKLRKIAKRLAKEDWRAYLKNADNDYFEEVMLQGMVIGYVKTSLKEQLNFIAEFVPKINNWSVCDSFCTGLKFTKENKQMVWDFLLKYLKSRQEYEIRFGVVMLLDYYVDGEYIDEVLEQLEKVKKDEYYVKMAVSWAISICYVKFPDKTLEYLRSSSFDDFTYNKTLQKITESLLVDKNTKVMIRGLKRNQ